MREFRNLTIIQQRNDSGSCGNDPGGVVPGRHRRAARLFVGAPSAVYSIRIADAPSASWLATWPYEAKELTLTWCTAPFGSATRMSPSSSLVVTRTSETAFSSTGDPCRSNRADIWRRLDGCREPSTVASRFLMLIKTPSANLTTSGPLEISRRYLDQNRRTYKYHTGESRHFDTVRSVSALVIRPQLTPWQPHGLSMSEDMRSTLHNLNLSRVIGTVPEDYFLARVSFPEPNSVLTKLMYDVLPAVVHDPSVDTPGRQRLYIVNSGSQRFDIVSASGGRRALSDALRSSRDLLR